MEAYPHEIIFYKNNIDMHFFICENNGSFVAKHWHNSMEFLYIIEGQYTVTIDNKPHTINAGDFIMVNPRDIHSTSSACYSKFFLLQISYDFIKKHIPNIDFIEFKVNYSKDAKKPNVEYIKTLLKELASLCQAKPNGYLLRFYSIVFDLLFHLNINFKNEISPVEQQKHEKYIDRLSKVTYYVKKHYMEEISLSDISAVVSLNPEYFSRFFKKHMGITFLEYLNSIRLEYAYNDLANTNYSISEILSRNGFSNYKMFMKLFKKRFGCTPSEKRKELLNH
ncbi:MAG: AraC family transcriptional regulator [Clostridiales bacterium]|jgi:AraC-like DNA-binding protein|nr:AraC family transcriptional regulator [Clostridiales bacterium]